MPDPQLFVVESLLWPTNDSLPEAWEKVGECMAEGPGAAISILAKSRTPHRAIAKGDIYAHFPEHPEKRAPIAVEIPYVPIEELRRWEGEPPVTAKYPLTERQADELAAVPPATVTSIMEAKARRLLREQEQGLRPSRPRPPQGRAS